MVDRKYSGILKKYPRISVLGASDEQLLAEYTNACLERDEALFAEFNINPADENAWQELAFALAERHVPAYGAKRRGRPANNIDENISMVLRWQEVKRRRECSDAEAYRAVAEQKQLPEKTIAERIKRIKRHDLKELVELLDRVEQQIGKAGMMDAFKGIHDS